MQLIPINIVNCNLNARSNCLPNATGAVTNANYNNNNISKILAV